MEKWYLKMDSLEEMSAAHRRLVRDQQRAQLVSSDLTRLGIAEVYQLIRNDSHFLAIVDLALQTGKSYFEAEQAYFDKSKARE